MFRGIRKLLLLIIILFFLPGACAGVSQDFNEDTWRKEVEAARVETLYAAHCEGGRFFNPWMPMENKGFLNFLRWKLSNSGDNPLTDNGYLPAVIPDAVQRIRALPEGNFILWVGHATFLMRLDGEYWITYPMFSDRVLLPKRVTPSALDADDLKSLGIQRLNVLIFPNIGEIIPLRGKTD